MLNQDAGAYSHHTIVQAKKEDHHSGIFAQLDAGEYHLRLAFVSDAALLQLPCQTVQLELAMTTIPRAKAQISAMKEASRASAQSELSLAALLRQSASAPLVLHRPEAISSRHVDPYAADHSGIE